MKLYALIALAVILTLLLGLPFREYRTQQLLPIKTLQAEHTDGGISIVTEVGSGQGADWSAAVEDLRKNASGDVFFDTAEQLVVTDYAIAVAAAQSGDLRPSAQVYLTEELLPTEGLYAYLKAHPSELRIKEVGQS